MFYETLPKTKEYILSQGEIEFVPAVKWKNASVLELCMKHEIVFRHTDGQVDDLGSFYLTLKNGFLYEMAKVEFATRCGRGLKLFMFELILKCAIREAALAGSSSLVIECDDPLIAEAFLTCRFKVEILEPATKSRPVYRGKKELAQERVDPLVNFTMGYGSL